MWPVAVKLPALLFRKNLNAPFKGIAFNIFVSNETVVTLFFSIASLRLVIFEILIAEPTKVITPELSLIYSCSVYCIKTFDKTALEIFTGISDFLSICDG